MDYNITWSIKKRASSYQRSSGRCDLCLAEKMVIATADKDSMLNSRSEIVSACRHRHKYKLGSFKAAIDTWLDSALSSWVQSYTLYNKLFIPTASVFFTPFVDLALNISAILCCLLDYSLWLIIYLCMKHIPMFVALLHVYCVKHETNGSSFISILAFPH